MKEKYFIIYFKPKNPSPQLYICNMLRSKHSSLEEDLLLSGISGYGLSYFSEGVVKRSYNILIQEILFNKYIINKIIHNLFFKHLYIYIIK